MEETVKVLVGKAASVEGGVTSKEDLHPVIAHEEWEHRAIVDGRACCTKHRRQAGVVVVAARTIQIQRSPGRWNSN